MGITPPTGVTDRTPANSWVVAGLMAALALVFANAMGGDFVWDDQSTVVENAVTHGWSHLPAALGWGDATPSYRLVRDLSQMLDYAIDGLNPAVYHAFNLLYHGLNTLLVYGLFRHLTGNARAAAWGALVFAVHPVHVDAVTYISGRRDLLSTLFFLVGLAAFIRYRQRGTWIWMAAAAGSAVLGLLAKEMAVTLPVVWFLYDVWAARVAGARGWLGAARHTLTHHGRFYGAGAVAAVAAVAWILLAQPVVSVPPHGDSWVHGMVTEVLVLGNAVRLLLFPTSLMLDYGRYFTPVAHLGDARLWAALAVLAVLVVVAYRLRRHPVAGFAFHWTWITFLPVMQIVPHQEIFAEHYLYLPSVGLCLLAGLALAQLSRHSLHGRRVTVLAATVVLLLAVRTADRNRDFADNIAVYTAQLPIYAGNDRVHKNLAVAYEDQGRVVDAARHFEAAVRINAGNTDSWLALGRIFRRSGDPDRALWAYTQAVASDATDITGWLGLGLVHQGTGNLIQAETSFREVLTRAPGNGEAWNNLGATYAMQGRLHDARVAFDRALAAPRVPFTAYLNAARLHQQGGRCGDARAVLARMATAVPDAVQARERARMQLRAACPEPP